ncbi:MULTISPECIES: hypothetical protein [unclassified Microbacterium]|uniref:hypothetical protein n=1 Tax=unclassified Microbacterium TaxID=2609290 RepID=UPI0038651351
MPSTVEITLDDRWFLPIPGDGDIAQWAREAASTRQREPDLDDDVDQVIAALVGFSEFADPDAAANLLFCPEGLPGRAIVSVFAGRTDLSSLDDLEDDAPAALPRQVLPFADDDPAVARTVSTVRQLPDGGVLGVLQLQRLHEGVLIETVAMSPSLHHLGLGLPWFEELTSRVTVVSDDARPEGTHVQSA